MAKSLRQCTILGHSAHIWGDGGGHRGEQRRNLQNLLDHIWARHITEQGKDRGHREQGATGSRVRVLGQDPPRSHLGTKQGKDREQGKGVRSGSSVLQRMGTRQGSTGKGPVHNLKLTSLLPMSDTMANRYPPPHTRARTFSLC